MERGFENGLKKQRQEETKIFRNRNSVQGMTGATHVPFERSLKKNRRT
jgi:hypothetical protein